MRLHYGGGTGRVKDGGESRDWSEFSVLGSAHGARPEAAFATNIAPKRYKCFEV
jgi:hypothetical protein